MEQLRILLVDDQTLFRKAIASLISTRDDMEVIGEASDGLEAVKVAQETQPDIILMDLHMPRCSGLEAVKAIKNEMPDVKVIMLTISDDDKDVFAAIRNGAEGYLLKDMEPHQLFEMLERARRGELAIGGILAAKILQEFRRPIGETEKPPEPFDDLTPREIEVLELIVEGTTNAEIAAALFISENTVKLYLRNILEKLHLQNRIQAAVYAVRHGLVSD